MRNYLDTWWSGSSDTRQNSLRKVNETNHVGQTATQQLSPVPLGCVSLIPDTPMEN